MINPKTGRYVAGTPGPNRVPIGTVRIRKRENRPKDVRNYIKIADMNAPYGGSKWIQYARYVWEKHKGPIPPGYDVHHKDENKLNDIIENLELLTRSEHTTAHAKKNNYTTEMLKQTVQKYFTLSGPKKFQRLSMETGIPERTIMNHVYRIIKESKR